MAINKKKDFKKLASMLSYEQNNNDIDADEEDENASVHVRYMIFNHFTVIVIFRSDCIVWQDCTSAPLFST